MQINEAVKLAIEKGGYSLDATELADIQEKYTYKLPLAWQNAYSLDPLFWQALGKALGWGANKQTVDVQIATAVALAKVLNEMPNKNFYQADKYPTGLNKTLHLWADGKSYDIICPVFDGVEVKPDWQYWAMKFFELRMTGGDEAKFWIDLY